MFTTLLSTQRAALTVLAFFGTFFVALSLGRLLKRRAGVRFGILFQLFSLTLAFYAAIWTYGVDVPLRNHIGAALILLGSAVAYAIIDRYLWDIYFEKRRQTPIPKFLREIVALFIFLIAVLLVLHVGYHASSELKVLLSGSGVLAIIIALAAQNVLGGIIAGMALQVSRPYKVGDWLHVGDHFAEVMEINWRSTRVRTNDAIYLDIPNNELVRQTIINLHYPTQIHSMRIRVGVDYNIPPNRVKDALLKAARNATGVVTDPPVKVFLVDFGESAVIYEIKFSMGNHAAYNEVSDAVRTNVWYELKRQRMTIPFPIRTLQVDRKSKAPLEEGRSEALAIMRREPIFQCLEDRQLDGLVKQAQFNHFGRGERVIEEGAEGQSMFILLRGTAQVSVSKNGAAIRVGVLRSGDCFGEMSLLTGEKRTATVRAEDDCEVLEISKPVMGDLLRNAPECLHQLSELLAKRKLENEGIIKDAVRTDQQASKQREYTASFLSRLRSFFEL